MHVICAHNYYTWILKNIFIEILVVEREKHILCICKVCVLVYYTILHRFYNHIVMLKK